MKKLIIPILAASMLAPFASAQLWVENSTDSNLTFVFRSVADANVNNQYDSFAGARVSIDLTNLSTSGFSLTFDIDNLSGGSGVSVGVPPELVDFNPGTITGFGFNIVPDWSSVSITEPTGWTLNVDDSFNPAAYDFEIGSTTTNGVNNAIDGGSSKSFTFSIATTGDSSSLTLADILDSNAFGNDFVFRIQETTGASGSDKVGVMMGDPDGGGGGSGFVPEPSTYGMFGALALLGLMVVRQVRRR